MDYICVGFTAATLFIFGYFLYRRVRSHWTWRNFAHEHNFVGGSHGIFSDSRMEGTYRGREVLVETKNKFGRSREMHTIYQTRLSGHVPPGLRLVEESLFNKLEEKTLSGGEDIEVGRHQLDKAFIIQAGDLEAARAFLRDEQVIDALLELHRLEGEVELNNGHLTFDRVQIDHTAELLATALNTLVRSADVLEERGEAMEEPAQPERTDEEKQIAKDERPEPANSEEDEEQREYIAEW